MSAMNSDDVRKKWSKVVAKAWSNPDYKKRLLSDSMAIFKEEGLPVSDTLKLRIIEEPKDEIVVVLPQPPEEGPEVENLEERLAATWWT